ncbi:MAG: ABC transporter permease, partial [Chloroflexi bacterium]
MALRASNSFAIALATAGAGLVLLLGFDERRRTLAIATALGARPRQIDAFVWSEAALMLAGGLITGAILGWLVATMLVKLLTQVFDPPPEHLAVPWVYVAAVPAATTASVVLSLSSVRAWLSAPCWRRFAVCSLVRRDAIFVPLTDPARPPQVRSSAHRRLAHLTANRDFTCLRRRTSIRSRWYTARIAATSRRAQLHTRHRGWSVAAPEQIGLARHSRRCLRLTHRSTFPER